jgi:hypothetical protein
MLFPASVPLRGARGRDQCRAAAAPGRTGTRLAPFRSALSRFSPLRFWPIELHASTAVGHRRPCPVSAERRGAISPFSANLRFAVDATRVCDTAEARTVLVRSPIGQDRRGENRGSEELEGGPIRIRFSRRDGCPHWTLPLAPLVESKRLPTSKRRPGNRAFHADPRSLPYRRGGRLLVLANDRRPGAETRAAGVAARDEESRKHAASPRLVEQSRGAGRGLRAYLIGAAGIPVGSLESGNSGSLGPNPIHRFGRSRPSIQPEEGCELTLPPSD